jgi:hypothetical protein
MTNNRILAAVSANPAAEEKRLEYIELFTTHGSLPDADSALTEAFGFEAFVFARRGMGEFPNDLRAFASNQFICATLDTVDVNGEEAMIATMPHYGIPPSDIDVVKTALDTMLQNAIKRGVVSYWNPCGPGFECVLIDEESVDRLNLGRRQTIILSVPWWSITDS